MIALINKPIGTFTDDCSGCYTRSNAMYHAQCNRKLLAKLPYMAVFKLTNHNIVVVFATPITIKF